MHVATQNLFFQVFIRLITVRNFFPICALLFSRNIYWVKIKGIKVFHPQVMFSTFPSSTTRLSVTCYALPLILIFDFDHTDRTLLVYTNGNENGDNFIETNLTNIQRISYE